jgi:hypothetical protein
LIIHAQLSAVAYAAKTGEFAAEMCQVWISSLNLSLNPRGASSSSQRQRDPVLGLKNLPQQNLHIVYTPAKPRIHMAPPKA